MSKNLKRFDKLIQAFWTQPKVTQVLNKMQTASDLYNKALAVVEEALMVARSVQPLGDFDEPPNISGMILPPLQQPCFAYEVAEMEFTSGLVQSLEGLRLELQSICDEYSVQAIQV